MSTDLDHRTVCHGSQRLNVVFQDAARPVQPTLFPSLPPINHWNTLRWVAEACISPAPPMSRLFAPANLVLTTSITEIVHELNIAIGFYWADYSAASFLRLCEPEEEQRS